MKIVTFTICIFVVVGLAFSCGWLSGPYNMKKELISMTFRMFREEHENGDCRHRNRELAFQVVCLLHEQRFSDVNKLMNGELDWWIFSKYSDSSPFPFPNEITDPETLEFLVKLARHRQKYPVTNRNKDIAETVSNVFARALEIEGKREED